MAWFFGFIGRCELQLYPIFPLIRANDSWMEIWPPWPDSSPERSPRRSIAREAEGRIADRRLRAEPAAPEGDLVDGPRANDLTAELIRETCQLPILRFLYSAFLFIADP